MAGFEALSERSRYLRFLTAKPRLTAGDLRYLTEVDGHDHFALVAEDPADPTRVIGVARFVRDRERPDTAEMAIVVGDAWQGRGVGSTLATSLVDAALVRGIRRFTASTLSENVAVHRLLEKVSARLEHDVTDHGLREVVAQLAA